jgi:hypothetical protein
MGLASAISPVSGNLLREGEDNAHPHLCGLSDMETVAATPSGTEGDAFRSGSEAIRRSEAAGLEVLSADANRRTLTIPGGVGG